MRQSFFCYVLSLVLSISSYLHASDPYSDQSEILIASIGDSITTAMNASSWGNQKEYNWSTGNSRDKRVKSHYFYLKNMYQDKEISLFNVAKSGALSNDLERQVDYVLEKNPDYVTILIGANDACNFSNNYEEEIELFAENVRNSINRLVNSKENIKILLLPIPNLYHLWKLGSHSMCQYKWDLFGICSNLLHSNRTEDERQHFQNNINLQNEKMHEIADEFSQWVIFDKSLADVKFERKHVSQKDCFHPSLEGQDLISHLSWKNSWFSQ